MSGALPVFQVEGPVDAPPVLLLHPIATNGALWAHQAQVWSATMRVIRVDLPGHGRSPLAGRVEKLADYADRIAEVLDALHIERAAVVGLSFGGMVAQALAVGHPQRVSALVLAHTTGRTDPAVRDLWERRLEQFEQQGMAAQIEPTLERWFTRSFALASPLTMAWVGRQIAATSPAGYTHAVRAIQQLDHLDALGKVRVPTLVVAGDSDSAVPPAAAQRLVDAIPGAQLHILEDAAHIGCVQQPVAFTEVVGRFLQRVASDAKSKETTR